VVSHSNAIGHYLLIHCYFRCFFWFHLEITRDNDYLAADIFF